MVKHLAATSQTVILGLRVRYVGPGNLRFLWYLKPGLLKAGLGRRSRGSYPRASARYGAPGDLRFLGYIKPGPLKAGLSRRFPKQLSSGSGEVRGPRESRFGKVLSGSSYPRGPARKALDIASRSRGTGDNCYF